MVACIAALLPIWGVGIVLALAAAVLLVAGVRMCRTGRGRWRLRRLLKSWKNRFK